MDFGSYCTTSLLIITFIFTHSDQVKAAAEIQNTCKNIFLEGKNAIFKQSPTSAPIIRDTTKWKLNRIVHFRPKAIENMFFSTTPSTIPTTYSTSKLPLTNNMIDSNYWNYPGGHFNVLKIGQFRDAKKNSHNNLYNKNTMPEIHFVSRIQKNSFNDGIMTTASDRLNSLPLERTKNIDFDYEDNVYDDLKNNNNKPLESKQFARPNNCSESKGTKVLIANFPFKPHNERYPFGRKAYPLLKDTFLDLYYWLNDEFKQEITTNPPVILQVEAQTPDSYTTKVFSLTNPNNIETSTNFLDLVLTLDNFSTSTKDEFYPDYLTEDVLKTVKTISLYPESSKLTNTQQEESHSPQIQTTAIFNKSKPSILNKGNEYLNKYKLDISHNETKFNKRSLEKFDPLEAAQVSLLPDMSTAESGSTIQDKIKFFEMYDDHTLNDSEVLSFENKSYENLLTSSLKSRNISSLKEQNIKREIEVSNVNIDNSTSFVETDNKSLNDNFNQTLASTANEHELITTKMHQNRTESLITTTKEVTSEASKENFRITKKPPTNFGNRYNNKRFSAKTIFDVSTKMHKPKAEIKLHRSFAASWHKYPYAAAYIHEPLQIHCDAASISAHWLIAAASCMSRMYAMHNDPLEGRSAYVTYCSNEWWNPQLIAYVKYSVMHPNFNRRNSVKRILYNIGLIRVVNSMTANCPAWQPVPLSHRIMTQLEEVEGITVGWGLDRLTRTQFDAVIRVQKPLSVYTGLVFSNICPGKQKNGKPKSAEEDLALKNVFCITLPPYNGEALDPTHGSLLLVQNKLVGLYLQEERRVFGVQSAQYTSIWRLLPWIFENAKEPEIADNFSFDIL